MGDYDKEYTMSQMKILEKASVNIPKNLKVIFKPHEACPIEKEKFPKLKFTIKNSSLVNLVSNADIVYTTSTTSSAVDAYCAGVSVISARDSRTLNMSPLRGCKGIQFASTSEDLVKALKVAATSKNLPKSKYNFFTLSHRLVRWKKLIVKKKTLKK